MQTEIGGVCYRQCRSRGSNVIRTVEEPSGLARLQRLFLIGLYSMADFLNGRGLSGLTQSSDQRGEPNEVLDLIRMSESQKMIQKPLVSGHYGWKSEKSG